MSLEKQQQKITKQKKTHTSELKLCGLWRCRPTWSIYD